MSLVDRLLNFEPATWAVVGFTAVLLIHFVPYLADPHHIREYPGPLLAKLSDIWLGYVAAQGHRSERVHELHKQYGTFVRIAPNHLSISDPEALQVVYGHGTGTLKSDFYDAFVSIQRGLFNTRSRVQHARKRKIVSNIFAQKNVLDFEPHVRQHLANLFRQWDKLCEGGKNGLSGDEGEGGWQGRDGRVWYDCLPWYNYLAFDIIGDLAFGTPFGMLDACKDSAPVAVSHKAAMAAYGSSDSSKEIQIEHFPAVQVLNDRGEYSAAMGVLPPHWRPLAKKIPWYSKGNQAVQKLAGIAVAAVAQRFANPSDRADLLSKLQEGRDDNGDPMGREELTAEALTQLIAGSDTTSNSSCALTYWLAKNQAAQRKLQQELDAALGSDDDPVASYEQVKRLPYLEAVINEALRIHATSGIGLPRLVPEGGLTVCGKFFPEGTVLSVPTYTIHRDKAVWGEDVDDFRPERWFEQDKNLVQKTFNPFSFGPRSCVGRNLANLELLVIVASIFRRYHFVLENPNAQLETREGFLRKPVECKVGMKQRHT
ncbi:cytochrome P450 monooxygenase pc-bph [Dichomitus squalens]|uniref:Cytochrome P450 monooxygenase pc-bph n=1 Tax=Dichomitus squalens TaxID=114155 RepID=A0A4Q9Q274_9APHY|nr:cytochrome P450 monooxygenase pc-bph [Dichomitus squalens]TBU61051.1 cytochrome P450 monooxygenase pc-bph [Dichomitus squalens]